MLYKKLTGNMDSGRVGWRKMYILRENFMEKKAMEVIFEQNALFFECLLEFYKWWLYLASGRTHCP